MSVEPASKKSPHNLKEADVLDGQTVGTVALGLVGLWLAHSYRRQVKMRIAEQMLRAYSTLWELTDAAHWESAILHAADREKLAIAMERWYYKDGAGMLMKSQTRELFVAIRHNLCVPAAELKPASLARSVGQLSVVDGQAQRSCATRRYFSLLRSQLKADLAMYRGDSHLRRLRRDERDLLKQARIYRPWHTWLSLFPLPSSRLRPGRCFCGFCGPAT